MLYGDIAGRRSTEVIYDSFEDGGMAEYGSGSPSAFTTPQPSTPTPQDGTYTLSADNTAYDECFTTSVADYPTPGTTFEWYTYFGTTGSTYAVNFFGPDLNNTYWTRVNPNGSEFEFYERTSGTNNHINTVASVTWPASTWIRVESVWYSDNTFDHTAYDTSDGSTIASMSGISNTAHTSGGGFGWAKSGWSGNNVHVDYYRAP